MRTKLSAGIIALALLISGIAHAQAPVPITFSVTPTSANGSAAPIATWSTSPVATSCTASGGWSGTMAGGSGTAQLATINKSASYTITCTWASVLGKATLNWTPPTTNSDGSPLTDLAGFHVYFGKAAGTLDQEALVGGATSTTADVTDLTPGTWFFAVASMNTKGATGAMSNVVSKTIAGTPATTASKTASVTIVPVPNPPTNLTVTEKIAFNVRANFESFAFLRGPRFGEAKLGAACDETRKTDDYGDYYVIARPSRAVTPPPPRGLVLVARCG